MEADALENAVGSKVSTVSESKAESPVVLRRGEQTKCVTWEV